MESVMASSPHCAAGTCDPRPSSEWACPCWSQGTSSFSVEQARSECCRSQHYCALVRVTGSTCAQAKWAAAMSWYSCHSTCHCTNSRRVDHRQGTCLLRYRCLLHRRQTRRRTSWLLGRWTSRSTGTQELLKAGWSPCDLVIDAETSATPSDCGCPQRDPWHEGSLPPWAGPLAGPGRRSPRPCTCTPGSPWSRRTWCPSVSRLGDDTHSRWTGSGSRRSTPPGPSCDTWWRHPRTPTSRPWTTPSERGARTRAAGWNGGCSSAGSTAAPSHSFPRSWWYDQIIIINLSTSTFISSIADYLDRINTQQAKFAIGAFPKLLRTA